MTKTTIAMLPRLYIFYSRKDAKMLNSMWSAVCNFLADWREKKSKAPGGYLFHTLSAFPPSLAVTTLRAYSIILGALSFSILFAGCTGNAQRPPEPLQSAAEFEQRGIEMYAAGDYAGAIRHFERAFEYYGRIDRREPMSRNRVYTAQSALLINNLPLAESALADLEELASHSDGQYQRYRLWLLQSEYLIRAQHPAQAIAPLERILAANAAPPEIVAAALVNRARIAVAAGAEDQNQWLRRAQSSADSGLNRNRLLRLRASILSRAGDHAAAEKLLQQALENYRQYLFQPGIAATLGELGQLMQARNSPDEARFFLRRALTLRLDLVDIPSAIELARRLQAIETQTGHFAAAEAYANQQKKLESLLTGGYSQL
jgi:tetratricopeptide (TPR) repeat protein